MIDTKKKTSPLNLDPIILMRQTYLILIYLFILSPVFSQNIKTFSVNGYVQDKESGEKLIGCYVLDSASKKGVLTNAFGYFNILLEAGTSTILVHHIGYSDQTTNLHINKDTTIVIKLSTQPINLDEMTIVSSNSEAKLSRPQMGQMTMTNKDVKKLPVLLGEADVMRALQILPGIQSASERSTGISVRGGSIDQNLFLLDDAPVFQISHLMGIFSVFNNDAVKDIKIYKGDIPANYGGRLSSLVDIRLKDGNMQKFDVAGGLGILCSDLSVEGPIVKDRASFIVSGKYSYLGGLYKLIGKSVDLTFYDLNCKLNAIIDPQNRIYISSYDGADNSSIVLKANYHNNTMSIRWNHVYNPELFSNVSFVYSNYKYSTAYSSTSDNNTLNYSWNSGIEQISLKAEYNYYLNNYNTIDFGASTTYKHFMPGQLEGNRTAIDNITNAQPFRNRAVTEQGVFEHALYISNQQKITDNLSFKYGVRASLYQDLGGHWVYNLNNYQVVDSFYAAQNSIYAHFCSVEPRLGMNYRVFENSSIKASYTYTTQQDQLLMKTNGGGPLDVWFPSDNNIKPQTSSQYSLGYVQYLFNNVVEASIEAYYKNMNNAIDYKDGATFLESNPLFTIDKTSYNFEEQLRTGKGYTYGAELMLKSDFEKSNGFISYTYARSYRTIPDINSGQPYLSPFDKPHTFDACLNYNISERISLSSNFRYQSGQVTTIPIYAMELLGKALTGYSKRNDYRLPPYQRLDISLTIKSKESQGEHFHSEWNVSIINVLNHANIQYVNFIAHEDNPGIIDAKGVSMFGIMPSISYHFNF
ncbi:MAG: carboxypeptidase-like regulatory domain-containing protein [Ignavibacteriales bacterium]|nr:carboxypeptidase-like regulatory domain-containing protein [Ignavibacteriales bacterium]